MARRTSSAHAPNAGSAAKIAQLRDGLIANYCKTSDTAVASSENALSWID